jgi:hypothetical protein
MPSDRWSRKRRLGAQRRGNKIIVHPADAGVLMLERKLGVAGGGGACNKQLHAKNSKMQQECQRQKKAAGNNHKNCSRFGDLRKIGEVGCVVQTPRCAGGSWLGKKQALRRPHVIEDCGGRTEIEEMDPMISAYETTTEEYTTKRRKTGQGRRKRRRRGD